MKLKKIISEEFVVIPDGRGGIREKIPVRVPALQNPRTGQVFLDVDSVNLLDERKREEMQRIAMLDFLATLISKPTYAKKLSRYPIRQTVTFNFSFGAGEPPEVDSFSCDSSRELAFA